MSDYDGLSDKEVEAERKFLEGVPTLNMGALFLPPIWGPAHGMWATILWYPVWLLADNCFYMAYSAPTTASIIIALVVGIVLTVVTFLFARLSQPFAMHRAIDQKGKTKAEYLRTERIWTIASVVAGCIMIAAATYYNVAVRPMMG